MKNVLLIVFSLAALTGLTQNPNLDYKNAVKVYNLSTYEENVSFHGDSSRQSLRNYTSAYQILHPTIAFQWNTRTNNFHEIELTNFMVSKFQNKTEIVNDSTGNVLSTLSGKNSISTLISIRYEYIITFNKNKDKKIVPSLGLSASPFFKQNNTSPQVPNLLNGLETTIGIRTYIIPRLTYYFSPRFFCDLNVPLCFTDINASTVKNENPTNPANQSTTTTFNLATFPKILSGRLGIGVKI